MVDAPEPLRVDQGHRRSRLEPAALVLLVVLAAIFGWWAWQKGAYFGVVLLPGTIVLCITAALLTVLAPWRVDLRRSRPAAIALASLAGLGLWALLSATWSPAPDVAVADGQRILSYALVFALGLWLCNVLGPRMELSLVPVVAAAGFAGIAAVVALSTGDNPRSLLEDDGTLDFPLGYRNANAAFFAIALFPALGLAAQRGLDPRARAASLGIATLCIALFLLSQSRASAPALLLAVVVYLLLSPVRLRALAWLVLAVLPAIAIMPALTDLYTTVNDEGMRQAIDEMRFAGTSAALCAAAGVVLGAFAVLFERRLPGSGLRTAAGNRSVAWGLAALAVAGAIGFVAATGDPVEWISERAEEFRTTGSPNASGEFRFSLNAGSERYDLWQVAVDDAAEDPLLGDGAGGFQYSYLEKRTAGGVNVRDAHSIELETLAELGIPGLALLLTALAAAATGVILARRTGPAAAGLGAVALASGTYWLAHSSIDWFWQYPAVSAPAVMLLGAACAPAVRALGPVSKRKWRPLLLAGLAVLAVSAVPPFLSERYIRNAYEAWRTDIDGAYDDLDRAATFNPLSNVPLLAEGAIARAADDPDRALDALREAADLRPEEWATHYLLAELQAERSPRLARTEIRVALELNPLDSRVGELATDLGIDPAQ